MWVIIRHIKNDWVLVAAIVDTNYGSKGLQSSVPYNHFSLLKTLEAGFGLKYLNHAADKNVNLITDLFN